MRERDVQRQDELPTNDGGCLDNENSRRRETGARSNALIAEAETGSQRDNCPTCQNAGLPVTPNWRIVTEMFENFSGLISKIYRAYVELILYNGDTNFNCRLIDSSCHFASIGDLCLSIFVSSLARQINSISLEVSPNWGRLLPKSLRTFRV